MAVAFPETNGLNCNGEWSWQTAVRMKSRVDGCGWVCVCVKTMLVYQILRSHIFEFDFENETNVIISLLAEFKKSELPSQSHSIGRIPTTYSIQMAKWMHSNWKSTRNWNDCVYADSHPPLNWYNIVCANCVLFAFSLKHPPLVYRTLCTLYDASAFIANFQFIYLFIIASLNMLVAFRLRFGCLATLSAPFTLSLSLSLWVLCGINWIRMRERDRASHWMRIKQRQSWKHACDIPFNI